MKKCPKKAFDKVMEMTRQLWQGSNSTISVSEFAKERIEEARKVKVLDWIAVIDILDGILHPDGFCPDATDDEVYCALRCLGWEVTDEVEESESL